MTASSPDDDEADARTIMEESQRRSEAKFYRYDGLLQSFDNKGKITDKRWTFDRVGSNGRSKAVGALERDVALFHNRQGAAASLSRVCDPSAALSGKFQIAIRLVALLSAARCFRNSRRAPT